jgi:hypothetical protein
MARDESFRLGSISSTRRGAAVPGLTEEEVRRNNERLKHKMYQTAVHDVLDDSDLESTARMRRYLVISVVLIAVAAAIALWQVRRLPVVVSAPTELRLKDLHESVTGRENIVSGQVVNEGIRPIKSCKFLITYLEDNGQAHNAYFLKVDGVKPGESKPFTLPVKNLKLGLARRVQVLDVSYGP